MKNTFERELADFERIRGISIAPIEAKDGTLYMEALIRVSDEPDSLPPFLEPKEDTPEWAALWLAALLMYELFIWMVR